MTTDQENVTFPCHFCNKEFDREDVRPYGPDRALICFPCMQETPERRAAAEEVYSSLLDELIAEYKMVVLTPHGPVGLEPK